MIQKTILNVTFFILLGSSPLLLAETEAENNGATETPQEGAVGQLREIEHQLDIQAIELEQQKIHARKLEKQMQCNWILLKAYELCEEQHQSESSQARLKCNKEEKQAHKKCIADISDQP